MSLSTMITNRAPDSEIIVLVGGSLRDAVTITISKNDAGEVSVDVICRPTGEDYHGVLGKKDKPKKRALL